MTCWLFSAVYWNTAMLISWCTVSQGCCATMVKRLWHRLYGSQKPQIFPIGLFTESLLTPALFNCGKAIINLFISYPIIMGYPCLGSSVSKRKEESIRGKNIWLFITFKNSTSVRLTDWVERLQTWHIIYCTGFLLLKASWNIAYTNHGRVQKWEVITE